MAGDPIPKTFKAKKPPRRLPQQSKKRAALAAERRQFVARILTERPRCQLPDMIRAYLTATRDNWLEFDADSRRSMMLTASVCSQRSTDVHEIVGRGRSGGIFVPSQGLTDDGVLALCRPCHDWVTTNPASARAIGAERHYSKEGNP